MFSNPKLYPSKKCKKKSSTVKVLNVDKCLHCKPKIFFPRSIALGLESLQIDTPCVHVFKSKARPINKVKKKSSTVKVLNVDKFLHCKPKRFFPRSIALGLDPVHIDTPCVHVFKSKALPVVDSGWFGAIVLVSGFLIRLVTDSGWFGIVAIF